MAELNEVRGRIEFRDVNFSYQPERVVLNEINLEIDADETVAIVGRSGSGKSTLAKLIPRFYDPVDGQVLIDGVDIRQYRLNSLRQNIGFVMQGSALFQGSILENLTFGKPISMIDVEAATQAAYIHDFVTKLPNGYHTIIGEQGAQLSEGQKQRVALARVLLQNTPILILDEPTAALDNESEFYIQEAMKEICKQRTVIVIAHRLSTIRRADKIVVIDQGRIAEEPRSFDAGRWCLFHAPGESREDLICSKQSAQTVNMKALGKEINGGHRNLVSPGPVRNVVLCLKMI